MDATDELLPLHPDFTGSLPRQLYAVKLVTQGADGGRKTYVFPLTDASSYKALVKRLGGEGMVSPGDKCTTHVATLAWTQTEDIAPAVKPEPEQMPLKKGGTTKTRKKVA